MQIPISIKEYDSNNPQSFRGIGPTNGAELKKAADLVAREIERKAALRERNIEELKKEFGKSFIEYFIDPKKPNILREIWNDANYLYREGHKLLFADSDGNKKQVTESNVKEAMRSGNFYLDYNLKK